ncbi:MAG: protein kinase [Anaerolineae bacterium]|nr:protein kinase [Gemmatimonadaceae bacterium]
MIDLVPFIKEALGDAYRIEREITGGGMSRLYLAVETALDRQVVIKVLPPDFASELSAARFKREIELTAHLQHPHILTVLTAGAKDGLLYYVMPFVAGESLRQRLEREKRLSVVDACRILREISDALAYAHGEGVCHRDLKPENILLQGNHAVLADFGIAGALMAAKKGFTGDGTQAERLTMTGMAVGTPWYMAPEQLAGERDIDGRADIYSLGLVGYELMAGERPFAELSGSALLVARLTEMPPPLHTVRPDVPVELSDAIAIAIAREPGERFQLATEFHDHVEGATPARSMTFRASTATASKTSGITRRVSAPGVPFAVRLMPRISKRLVMGAGVIVASVAGVFVFKVWRSGQGLTENLVAVAPFDVLHPGLGLWKEGLVDVLSRNLDGAGPLHTVTPTVIVRQWDASRRADQDNALELGRKLHANYVVFGTLLTSGTDSVRLRAELRDVATSTMVSNVELRDAADRIDRIADSVTVTFLRDLGQSRAVGAYRGTTAGSTSLQALKAFLQGEQFYRRSAWDSSIAYYERAIGQDSTFSLALRRAGLAISWRRSTSDSLSRALLLRAGAFNRRLGPRDSLLTVADSLQAALVGLLDDTAYVVHAKRLFTTLEKAAERYPNDPEVWHTLGDAHWHFPTPGVRVTEREVLDAFDRSIALDSAFSPAYIHAIDLSLTLNGDSAAQRYVKAYVALNPTDVEAEGIRLVAKLLDARQARSSEVKRLIDTLPDRVVQSAYTTVRRWPDSAETGVRLARRLTEPRRGSFALSPDSVSARLQLITQLTYRGHVREAYRLLGSRPSRTFGELALIGVVPNDSASAVFGRWLRTGAGSTRHALWWWSSHGDTLSLQTFARGADSVFRLAATPVPERRSAYYDFATSQAYLGLARRDTAEALRRFAEASDTLCDVCFLDRLVQARVLAARGQERDAISLLAARLPVLISASELLLALERGRIARRVGDRETAIDAFTRIVSAWQHADPELRPAVAEARAALTQLGGARR